MKRPLMLIVIVIFSLCASPCRSEIPHLINYQGMLTQTDDTPLDGTYDLSFKIYSSESGNDSLWWEHHTGIQVTDGLFNIILGSISDLDLAFDADYWLGITVGTESELSPRIRLTSVGYAYRADTADYAISAGSDEDWTISDNNVYRLEGNIGIGTSTPSEKLDVEGTAKVTGFKMSTGASNGYVLTSDASGVGNWQAGGGAYNGWVFRVTDGADTALTTGGPWGIARYGNVVYGNRDSTHVNLGVACTTGISGQNYKYCTVGGGLVNSARGDCATVGGGKENTASWLYTTVGGG